MNQENADKLAKELENWPEIKQDVENIIEETKDWEDPCNIFGAFDAAIGRATGSLSPQIGYEFDLCNNHLPSLIKFRRILIAVGYYREISEDELYVKGMYGMYERPYFKLNNKKWGSDMRWLEWSGEWEYCEVEN